MYNNLSNTPVPEGMEANMATKAPSMSELLLEQVNCNDESIVILSKVLNTLAGREDKESPAFTGGNYMDCLMYGNDRAFKLRRLAKDILQILEG